MTDYANGHILIIDDNPAMDGDFRKVLRADYRTRAVMTDSHIAAELL